MKIKILSMLTVLGFLAAGNVMAADHRHGHHNDYKRKDVRIVVKKPHFTKRVVTTYHHGSKHKNRTVVRTNVRHNHHHDRSDHLGILVGGIVLGSVLAGH